MKHTIMSMLQNRKNLDTTQTNVTCAFCSDCNHVMVSSFGDVKPSVCMDCGSPDLNFKTPIRRNASTLMEAVSDFGEKDADSASIQCTNCQTNTVMTVKAAVERSRADVGELHCPHCGEDMAYDAKAIKSMFGDDAGDPLDIPVSYTHLTLPTICSV